MTTATQTASIYRAANMIELIKFLKNLPDGTTLTKGQGRWTASFADGQEWSAPNGEYGVEGLFAMADTRESE